MTIRKKMLSVVAITAIGFLVLVAASTIVLQRVETKLTTIENHFVPKVELEPTLEAQLDRISRGFLDAVGARDNDALDATRAEKAKFEALLDAAKGALDPAQTTKLRAALDTYYASGRDVSERLMRGDSGEPLTIAIAAMQSNQAAVAAQIKATASLDRKELRGAFVTANANLASANWLCLLVSLVCVAIVVSLCGFLTRDILRSFSRLTAGFGRFGQGEFAEPIAIVGADELADVAKHANTMAASLERLVREQRHTERQLQASNQELEAFSYSVAHDLRSPLRGINGFSRALVEDWGDKMDSDARAQLDRICAAADRMGSLIDALLSLARVSRAPLTRKEIKMSTIVDGVVQQIRVANPGRDVEFVNAPDVTAHGDATLIRATLENLIGNAWKFTANKTGAKITFGTEVENGDVVYFIRDNGAGFDMAYASKLFAPFQRLHTVREFAGTGIGLATVQRIIRRHGGRIWAEGVVDEGATFRFTLGDSSAAQS